jgi:PAS domain S-box-containing protein
MQLWQKDANSGLLRGGDPLLECPSVYNSPPAVQGWHYTQMADEKADQVGRLLATPDLANALESEQFKHFLDQVPIAIIVSEMKGRERIAYANPEFEKLSGQAAADVEGQSWSVLHGAKEGQSSLKLGEAIVDSKDCVGTFALERPARDGVMVDAYSNLIVDDEGQPARSSGCLPKKTRYVARFSIGSRTIYK